MRSERRAAESRRRKEEDKRWLARLHPARRAAVLKTRAEKYAKIDSMQASIAGAVFVLWLLLAMIADATWLAHRAPPRDHLNGHFDTQAAEIRTHDVITCGAPAAEDTVGRR